MIIIFYLILNLFPDSYSDHLSQISGFETSIKSAREELETIKTNLKKAKTGAQRNMYRNDMATTKNNIDFYFKQIKQINKHIMIEHTEEDKERFKSRFERNKRKKKVE